MRERECVCLCVCVCMSVCECVCMSKREREREREYTCIFHNKSHPWGENHLICISVPAQANLLIIVMKIFISPLVY